MGKIYKEDLYISTAGFSIRKKIDDEHEDFSSIEELFGNLTFYPFANIKLNKLIKIVGDLYLSDYCTIIMDNLMTISGNVYIGDKVYLSLNNLITVSGSFNVEGHCDIKMATFINNFNLKYFKL